MSTRVFLGAAMGLVGLGAALRLVSLGAQELWTDESFSFYVTTLPDWIALIRTETNPPLYYLLLRGWVRVAGESEAAIRGLSALFGTAAVGAAIWAFRPLLGRRGALLCGAVAAGAPMAIYYGQEARSYALLLLLLFACVGTFVRGVAGGSLAAWVGFAGGATLALYTHYLAAFGLLPIPFWLMLARPGARVVRRALLAGSAALLAFLPWAWLAFAASEPSLRRVDWIREAWAATPPLWAIPKSLATLLLGAEVGLTHTFYKQLTDYTPAPGLRLLGLGTLAALGVVACSRIGERRLGLPDPGRRKLWLASLLLGPLFALFALSFAKPLYLVGRYDMVAFPGAAAVTALALAQLAALPRRGALLAALAGAGLLLPVGSKLLHYYAAADDPPAIADRVAARELIAALRPGEGVVVMGDPFDPFLYYLRREGVHCQEAECRSASGLRFALALFPRDGSAPLELPAPADSLLVVFRPYKWEEDRHWFTEGGMRLIDGLRALGYRQGPERLSREPTGVLRFRRSATSREEGR